MTMRRIVCKIAIIFWLNLAEFNFHDTLRDTTKTSETKEEYVDGSWYTHIVSYLIKHYQRLSQGAHSLSVSYRPAQLAELPRSEFDPELFFIGPESDHWQCLSVTH